MGDSSLAERLRKITARIDAINDQIGSSIATIFRLERINRDGVDERSLQASYRYVEALQSHRVSLVEERHKLERLICSQPVTPRRQRTKRPGVLGAQKPAVKKAKHTQGSPVRVEFQRKRWREWSEMDERDTSSTEDAWMMPYQPPWFGGWGFEWQSFSDMKTVSYIGLQKTPFGRLRGRHAGGR